MDGNSILIKRKFFDANIKDFEKAWKSAAVVKVNESELMNGYLLSKVQEDSVLQSLGLKQNDIIKKINDIKLDNYEQAFKLYKNIKELKSLSIQIYRDNRLLELMYEIE